METKGIIYLSIALLTYAFTHIIDKIGIDKGVDASVFSFFKGFFTLLIIAIVWFALRKKESLRFEKATLKNLVILGTVASGIVVLLGIYALNFTTATNRGMMQGMYTAFTIVFAFFMLKERLPRMFYPTFLMMTFGIILITSKGLLQMPNKGDWLLFAAVPLIGFCNTYAKKTMQRLKSLTVTFGRGIFGALFLLLVLPFLGLKNISTLQNGFLWVVLSGILSGVRIIAFYKGISLEGPTLATTMLNISPAVTALAAFLILGETLNLLQFSGLVLVLFGSVVLIRLKAEYKKPVSEMAE